MRLQFRLCGAESCGRRVCKTRAHTAPHTKPLAGCSHSPLPFACADNIALGTACGKMFRCGVLSVTDVGDSDILRSTMPEA